MMLYMVSNTILDTSFAVHQCAKFTHNTKASHDMSVKRICWYLQETTDKGLVFNPYKIMAVDFYIGTYCVGFLGNDNPQYPICDKISNGFVTTFPNCYLLRVTKVQT